MSGPHHDGEPVSARARQVAETTDRARLRCEVSKLLVDRAAKLIEESARRIARSEAWLPARDASPPAVNGGS
ncbi:hypothetical protein [Kutzneria buriramensis]|uniref:Uncharacterized protein n=1 Tax=Kutzneria buriramensis TaxID=1045776 RepID=A0A3E0GYV9_9PSEU|nr:hypothetical protein [Kutzneria buriramensis]REH34935.1 hypothetical protein BCF44_119211 [Kutzneria buriramensis]